MREGAAGVTKKPCSRTRDSQVTISTGLVPGISPSTDAGEGRVHSEAGITSMIPLAPIYYKELSIPYKVVFM
jgi:hypothetical protein